MNQGGATVPASSTRNSVNDQSCHWVPPNERCHDIDSANGRTVPASVIRCRMFLRRLPSGMGSPRPMNHQAKPRQNSTPRPCQECGRGSKLIPQKPGQQTRYQEHQPADQIKEAKCRSAKFSRSGSGNEGGQEALSQPHMHSPKGDPRHDHGHPVCQGQCEISQDQDK